MSYIRYYMTLFIMKHLSKREREFLAAGIESFRLVKDPPEGYSTWYLNIDRWRELHRLLFDIIDLCGYDATSK